MMLIKTIEMIVLYFVIKKNRGILFQNGLERETTFLKSSVYFQYYLLVLTMFVNELNNILVTYLDFRYLCGVSDIFYYNYH